MNEIVTQIQTLLEQRQQGYIAATQVLLKKLEFVTTALKDACKEHGDADADRIQWADIQMGDEVVFLIGTIDMIPGSVVPTQDGHITLTADTASRFQRKVVFNISLEAFEKHTPKELVDIIHQSVIISQASQNAAHAAQPVQSTDSGFDLTKLTTEQQQSLINYLKIQPEKGPTN